MVYLSQLLGYEVLDSDGASVGRLGDLIVPTASSAVAALVVRTAARGVLALPWSAVGRHGGKTIYLAVPCRDWTLYAVQENDTWLARDVLDKEVVDTDRARLVRVNAVILSESPQTWQVAGVEVGSRGLLARLGLGRLADGLSLPHGIIPWDKVSLSRGDLRRLEQLHPTQIASIVHELPPGEGSDLVEALSDEVAAGALEEIHPDRQADLLDDMAPQRAADILEEMAPDEAADILQDLPEAKAQELLRLMDSDEATDVAELLTHPEDSAGGIMTTEYAALSPELTVAEAVGELRRRFTEELDDIHLHYIYVTDEAERLLGVVPLWSLIAAAPERHLADLMRTKIVSVQPDQDAEEAARLIVRYSLMAVPVVDSAGRMRGIVTIDDAVDLFLPDSWRQQLPRMY